jgi:hypothetical protein
VKTDASLEKLEQARQKLLILIAELRKNGDENSSEFRIARSALDAVEESIAERKGDND